MKADLWFPTIIWQGSLKQVNNYELAEYVSKMQNDSPGRKISNYGGWQSDAQDLLSQKPVAVEVLLQGIHTSINQCTKMAGLPTLQISDFWWNVNPKGSYNHPHNHRDSLLSGVYYIDATPEQGRIQFYRDDDAEYFLPRLPKYTQITSQKATYDPAPSKIIIFPSWIKHSVEGNPKDQPRISMSFNTMIAMTPENDEIARLNGFQQQ